ncbi:hypothetical protein N1851_008276 [Merluccius polli]|uniref:Uncharacterized protein n=1 Tax=Merluccius polli TaxID=89951 RepID=A0AA47P8U1_MERPO|nr:hypothetical protein N1851_008276 [Merluccius polli]
MEARNMVHLGLNVPRLPRYMVKALPEVGVEALSDRRLCQTFPADPHNTFGSARSDRHPPPPSQPTHHQVAQTTIRIRPPHPKAEGGYPLVYRNKYCHPCPAPLTSGNSRVEESPTPLEKTGSRALAMRRAEDRTAKVPAFGRRPAHTAPDPLWPLLLVVSRREGGPTSSLRAVPGRAPWV